MLKIGSDTEVRDSRQILA